MAHSLRRRFHCPVELSLEILQGKWKPVILAHLKQRPLHYSDLRRLIPRLSDKMLTQRLTDLEEQGLVARAKQGKRGAPAVYRLTPRGESLRHVLQSLYDWGQAVAPEVGATIEPVEPA